MLADHRHGIAEMFDEPQRVDKVEARQVGQVIAQGVTTVDVERDVQEAKVLLQLATADRRAVDRMRFIAECADDIRQVATRSATKLDCSPTTIGRDELLEYAKYRFQIGTRTGFVDCNRQAKPLPMGV